MIKFMYGTSHGPNMKAPRTRPGNRRLGFSSASFYRRSLTRYAFDGYTDKGKLKNTRDRGTFVITVFNAVNHFSFVTLHELNALLNVRFSA